ncbi:MAG: CGNR zinc finger domain-containing protein [Microbacterium sp.]
MIFDPPIGQWFVAQDGQRWWFDSGSIAFDFAYTGGFPGPPEWEYWHGPEDVARWWRERFGAAAPVSGADYERARELRQMIALAVDRLLATIARAAVTALAQPGRIRVCGADDCAVMYLDTSRSGNRAWCSPPQGQSVARTTCRF